MSGADVLIGARVLIGYALLVLVWFSGGVFLRAIAAAGGRLKWWQTPTEDDGDAMLALWPFVAIVAPVIGPIVAAVEIGRRVQRWAAAPRAKTRPRPWVAPYPPPQPPPFPPPVPPRAGTYREPERCRACGRPS